MDIRIRTLNLEKEKEEEEEEKTDSRAEGKGCKEEEREEEEDWLLSLPVGRLSWDWTTLLVEASFRALYAPGEGIKRTCHVFPDPPASITKSFFSRGPCLESYTLRDRDQQVMVILRAAGWFWERSDRENRDRTELESVLVENLERGISCEQLQVEYNIEGKKRQSFRYSALNPRVYRDKSYSSFEFTVHQIFDDESSSIN